MQEQHGFDSLPLLVRPGSVIPIGARHDGPEYDYADGVALHLFDPAALTETTVLVPTDGGATVEFRVRRQGRQLTVFGPDPDEQRWSVVRPADELGDGSASTTVAESASVCMTLPGPVAEPLPPRKDS